MLSKYLWNEQISDSCVLQNEHQLMLFCLKFFSGSVLRSEPSSIPLLNEKVMAEKNEPFGHRHHSVSSHDYIFLYAGESSGTSSLNFLKLAKFFQASEVPWVVPLPVLPLLEPSQFSNSNVSSRSHRKLLACPPHGRIFRPQCSRMTQ